MYSNPGVYTVSLTLTNKGGEDTEVKEEYICVYPRGDLNRNFLIDIGDVAKVAYMAAGHVKKDYEADFNGDNDVYGADAAYIAYYYVGAVYQL